MINYAQPIKFQGFDVAQRKMIETKQTIPSSSSLYFLSFSSKNVYQLAINGQAGRAKRQHFNIKTSFSDA